MQYTKTIHPVQQLTTGEQLSVCVYTYIGTVLGPTIYLQANLHGPEIFGTVLLGKLMQYLDTRTDIPGKIVIVPCANPMGVQSVAYNSLVGRWNPHTGTNWNRIFSIQTRSKKKLRIHEEVKLALPSSTEEILSATLSLLSLDAEYCIDIHTSGSENLPHIFRYVHDDKIFDALGASVHLAWDVTDACGAFDESHVLPYIGAADSETVTHACTWEVHHHGGISESVLGERHAQLVAWLEGVWGVSSHTSLDIRVFPIVSGAHLPSPVAGYYTWVCGVGETVSVGEVYAHVYQPWSNTWMPVVAIRSFLLLSIYGVQAIASGEQIAWVVYL